MSKKFYYLNRNGLKKLMALFKFGHKKIWHGSELDWRSMTQEEQDEYDQCELEDMSTTPFTFNLLPIGVILPYGGDEAPSGMMMCFGQILQISAWPALYKVIGTKFGGDGVTTFKLPDLRECTLVGAGENNTDTIDTHDVYTVGEFKDDQIQSHTHTLPNAITSTSGVGNAVGVLANPGIIAKNAGTDKGTTGRFGNVTHGKQKGVNFIIIVK